MRNYLLLGLLLLGCAAGVSAQPAATTDVNLLFAGNSITYGHGLADREQQAPPAVAARLLGSEEGIGAVRMANAAVSGSTTFDFLPGTGKYAAQLFAEGDRLAAEPGVMVISLMLGTNDSAESGPTGAPASPAAYVRNLQTIVDTLLLRYPRASIVLHRPIWYSPNTQNTAVYLKGGLRRLRSYAKPLAMLVESYQRNGHLNVALGDTRGFELFEADAERLFLPEQGPAGSFCLHPNAAGAELLGQLWEVELLKAVRRRAPEPDPDPSTSHTMKVDYYAAANRALTKAPDVVFMGNSITAGWVRMHPDFFARNNFAGRGIGGQTSCEMLVRFRPDVIDLKPKAVVILAGINDIARNQGYIDLRLVYGNIVSMCELAKLHGIKVVLCSLTPCAYVRWRPDIRPAENVRLLNAMLRRYAEEHLITYVDYYSALADENGGLQEPYSRDGCHLREAGYDIMEGLVIEGIRQALRNNKLYSVD